MLYCKINSDIFDAVVDFKAPKESDNDVYPTELSPAIWKKTVPPVVKNTLPFAEAPE